LHPNTPKNCRLQPHAPKYTEHTPPNAAYCTSIGKTKVTVDQPCPQHTARHHSEERFSRQLRWPATTPPTPKESSAGTPARQERGSQQTIKAQMATARKKRSPQQRRKPRPLSHFLLWLHTLAHSHAQKHKRRILLYRCTQKQGCSVCWFHCSCSATLHSSLSKAQEKLIYFPQNWVHFFYPVLFTAPHEQNRTFPHSTAHRKALCWQTHRKSSTWFRSHSLQ
jgi:hypothetical protein